MNRVVRGLYNIILSASFILSSPYYFFRMWRRGSQQKGFPWKKDFAQRFGRYDSKLKQAITNRHRLWMHAVSVGEVNVSTQLIQAMETRLPNLKIIISTTTTTAMEGLQRKLPSHVSKIYYPIDRRAWVSRALGTIRPEAIVLVEAEIWPNFLWRANQMQIPVFLINARLSQKSYRGYKRFGFLFRPLFASFTGVGAQNEEDAAKLFVEEPVLNGKKKKNGLKGDGMPPLVVAGNPTDSEPAIDFKIIEKDPVDDAPATPPSGRWLILADRGGAVVDGDHDRKRRRLSHHAPPR